MLDPQSAVGSGIETRQLVVEPMTADESRELARELSGDGPSDSAALCEAIARVRRQPVLHRGPGAAAAAGSRGLRPSGGGDQFGRGALVARRGTARAGATLAARRGGGGPPAPPARRLRGGGGRGRTSRSPGLAPRRPSAPHRRRRAGRPDRGLSRSGPRSGRPALGGGNRCGLSSALGTHAGQLGSGGRGGIGRPLRRGRRGRAGQCALRGSRRAGCRGPGVRLCRGTVPTSSCVATRLAGRRAANSARAWPTPWRTRAAGPRPRSNTCSQPRGPKPSGRGVGPSRCHAAPRQRPHRPRPCRAS